MADTTQTAQDATAAFENGADGVFCIAHRGERASFVAQCYQAAREIYPGAWIGVNFLDLAPSISCKVLPDDVDGLWVDNPDLEDARRAAATYALLREMGVEYFGGVAFKYQKDSADFAQDALLAQELMDVVTTSGPATGSPPSPQKINTMRTALGPDRPLAIASGVSSQNVRSLMQAGANYFLVNSSLQSEFDGMLDGNKIKELAALIHED